APSHARRRALAARRRPRGLAILISILLHYRQVTTVGAVAMHRPASRGTLRAVVAAIVLGTADSASSQPSELGICNVGPRPAPLDFTLPAVDGGEVTLSDYAGQVILLDFWATWCAPCRAEIPGLVELYEKHKDSGFVVLGVAVDDTVDALE